MGSLWMARMEGRLSQSASNSPAPSRRQPEDNRLPASNSPASSRRQPEDNRLLEDRRLMDNGPGDDSSRYAKIKGGLIRDFLLQVFFIKQSPPGP